MPELVDRTLKQLQALGGDSEMILVDDCSKDESWQALMGLKQQHPETLKIVRFSKNFGQHNATLCGMRIAKGEWVITMDDDLQHRPEDIAALIETATKDHTQVVYGIPQNGNHKPTYRKLGGQFWNSSTKYLDEALGQGSSFRLIDRKVVEAITGHNHHFVYIDEILNWHTRSISLAQVDFEKSRRAKSGYTARKLFGMTTNLTLYYSRLPLKMIIYFGLVMSMISFGMGLFFILKKIIKGVAVPGYTSLIVTIFFSTSLILICLGVIGQYLGKIHAALNHKPTYTIKESHL